MMIDTRTEIALRQLLPTGSTGRSLFADVIDQGRTNQQGSDLHLAILINEAVTSGGSAAVAFEIASDAQGSIATDGSATILASFGPVPVSQLTAGRLLAMKLPPIPSERYLGLLVNIATATLTGGRVSAFLTDGPGLRREYGDNVA